MTIQELIDILNEYKDKTRKVYITADETGDDFGAVGFISSDVEGVFIYPKESVFLYKKD